MNQKFRRSFRQNGMWILSACIMIMLLIFVGFMLFSPGSTEDHQIHLPQEKDSSPDSSDNVLENSGFPVIAVTPETVQSILQTLNQPDSYIRTFYVDRFWNGGESRTSVSVWAKGGKLRVSEQLSDRTVNYLYDGASLAMWHGETAPLYFYQSREAELYARLQHIPDYRSLLRLQTDCIVDAGYVFIDGYYRLMIQVVEGTLAYTDVYFVSLETGLLESVEQYDGEQLIYKMSAISTELTAPDDSAFLLPTENS